MRNFDVSPGSIHGELLSVPHLFGRLRVGCNESHRRQAAHRVSDRHRVVGRVGVGFLSGEHSRVSALIGRLWQDIKKNVTRLDYFPTFKGLVVKIEEVFLNLSNLPQKNNPAFRSLNELTAASASAT